MPPDRLTTMYEMQKALQGQIPGGVSPPPEGWKPSAEELSAMTFQVMALFHELFEAMQETGWKPWASKKYVNRKGFNSEIVDAWHFLMNLMIWSGMTPEQLYEGYVTKNSKNWERHTLGYDGVTTKCTGCKREFSDPGVDCSPGVCAIKEQTVIVPEDLVA